MIHLIIDELLVVHSIGVGLSSLSLVELRLPRSAKSSMVVQKEPSEAFDEALCIFEHA